ncbi:MAG: hypothetical protein WCF90_09180 [Methanomicrobiales archaeon]
MDLETHIGRITEADVNYYTHPLKVVDLTIIKTLKSYKLKGVKCAFGVVEVTEKYTGYKMKRGDTILGIESLSLPPLTFRTKAFWLVPSTDTEQNVLKRNLDFA